MNLLSRELKSIKVPGSNSIGLFGSRSEKTEFPCPPDHPVHQVGGELSDFFSLRLHTAGKVGSRKGFFSLSPIGAG